MQLIVETLLFYHPLVWWVSNSVRRDREYLCDDLVVHRGKIDNLRYAQTLTDLETFRQKEGLDMKRIYSAPAAAAKPLLNRIKRIMNMNPDRDRRAVCLAAWPCLVAVVILAALPVWAVFFDSGRPSPGSANAALFLENEQEKTTTATSTTSQSEPEEILLEVYSLEKIHAAPDMFDDHELQESLQEYLVQSYRGKYNPEIGTFPASCKVKGNLLIVMATAKQQEQIAAFLEKLEATAAKLAGEHKETGEVETPEEGRKEYGMPSLYTNGTSICRVRI